MTFEPLLRGLAVGAWITSAAPEAAVFRIFVGNLPQWMSDADLRAAFEAHGRIASARIVLDSGTGHSRGFGFVEMPDHQQGRAAIAAMSQAELDGHRLEVAQARPRATRDARRSRLGTPGPQGGAPAGGGTRGP